ncbi:hypothetical protein B0T09DRAFT_24015 [Sordaria sp. MPI-SDFR-AT-0083]|nr:hypothetical protein B0T09DRAFT_24015 [Sordaria sp. MPI-SDFR-AT-0083]
MELQCLGVWRLGSVQLPDNDTDSTLGSDVESSTASISSNILKYRTIESRTYHSDSVTDGEYWAPNDNKANEMLDIFHRLATLLFDGEQFMPCWWPVFGLSGVSSPDEYLKKRFFTEPGHLAVFRESGGSGVAYSFCGQKGKCDV